MSLFLGACSHHNNGTGDDDDGTGGNGPPDACIGLQCNVTNCRAMSKPDTAISGTVFAPNGTLPLYGINVYVPATDPGTFTAGATCSRCADGLPGNPVVQTISDERGNFELIGVPSGDNIPLVITSGKWRKTIVIPHVDDCTEHAMTPAETSLPRTRAEGDMPEIAITTGGADSLECLVRKLGVADQEITTDQGGGRVHLYHSNGGKSQFVTGYPGGSGQVFSEAQTLWTNLDQMKKYDLVFFSCEGAQYPDNKPQAAIDTVKAYADFGGRVFATHWHNLWLEGSVEEHDQGMTQKPPASWTSLGTWTNRDPSELNANSSAVIDEMSNPKGQSFASWMLANGGSTTRDTIALQNQPPDPDTKEVLSTGRTSLASTDLTQTERWVYLPDQGGGTQNFQFTTPIEVDSDQRCGKFVFSDMHVSGTTGDGDYPDSCGTSTDMTPQEKALAFMFFDIASCVGILF
ncbi:MAG TPA: hypothetical protein VH165_14100 [Kofleriaceae bacterium]|nr:hypothetical protein [Kofleriaceae bacterium]